jgi:subtilisin family serine protease
VFESHNRTIAGPALRRLALALLVSALALAVGIAPARSAHRAVASWPGASATVAYSSEAALDAAVKAHPAAIVRRIPTLRVAEVRPAGTPTAFAAAVSGEPGIDYVEPLEPREWYAEPALMPAAVPGGAYEWQFAATGADRVPPDVVQAARGVTIAVVDTGADLTAPDLAAKSPGAFNVRTTQRDVRDDMGHGTFVASIAAGSPSNGEGIAGFGGEAQLLAIKAGPGDGSFTDLDEAAAITYAVDHGAKVVNLSLGGPQSTATEKRAVEYAVAHDVLLVAAVGNEHDRGNPTEYPAALIQPAGSNGVGGPGLAVAASTLSGSRAHFSNTGSYVSLAAPGENVFGAVSALSSRSNFPRVALPGSLRGSYGYSSGTSFAAPQVTGAAALVWGANPLLSARQVAQVLKDTASGHRSWNPELGYGVIDVAAAVAKARAIEAVQLRTVKSGTKAYLYWRGTPSVQSFTVSVSVDGGRESLLLDHTAKHDDSFEGKSGHTYRFRVSGYDAAGTLIATSAVAPITLGRAKANLTLSLLQRKGRNVILMALLRSPAVDATPASRMISLEGYQRGSWIAVGVGQTDPAGRAFWFGQLRPGNYRLRARHAGALDLAPALSKPLTLRIR